MTDCEREVLSSPTTRDRVNITATNTARRDLDINVVVAKRLERELAFVEVSPRLRRVDLETGCLIWIRHFGGLIRWCLVLGAMSGSLEGGLGKMIEL